MKTTTRKTQEMAELFRRLRKALEKWKADRLPLVAVDALLQRGAYFFLQEWEGEDRVFSGLKEKTKKKTRLTQKEAQLVLNHILALLEANQPRALL